MSAPYLTKRQAAKIYEDNYKDSLSQLDYMKSLIKEGYEIEGVNTKGKLNFGNTLFNVPESIVTNVEAIGQIVFDPVGTVTNLAKIPLGAILYGLKNDVKNAKMNYENVGLGSLYKYAEPVVNFMDKTVSVIDEKTDAIDVAMEFVGGISDRYGSKDNVLHTIENDPVGFVMDVAAVFAGGGAAAKGLGKAATASGMVRTGKVLTATGKGMSRFSRIIEPTTMPKKISRAMFGQNTALGRAVGKRLDTLRSSTTANMLRVTEEKLAQLAKKSKQMTGKRVTSFLSDHGIWGSFEEMRDQCFGIRDIGRRYIDRRLWMIDDMADAYRSSNPGSTAGLYKPKSAQKLLIQARKVLDDIGDDIRHPEYTATIKEIDDLLDAYKPQNLNKSIPDPVKQGLTFQEMDRVKRIGSDTMSMFNKAGQTPEIAGLQKNMGKLYSDLNDFMSKELLKHNFDDYAVASAENLVSHHVGKIIDDTIIKNPASRSGSIIRRVSERMSLIGGAAVLGAGAAFGIPYLMAAGGLGLTYGIYSTPVVKSYMMNRIRLLNHGEFKALSAFTDDMIDVVTGKKMLDPSGRTYRSQDFNRGAKIYRQVMGELKRDIFPVMRDIGVLEGMTEERWHDNKSAKAVEKVNRNLSIGKE